MKKIILSILTMVSLLILTMQVNACSCIAGITPREFFDNSEAVFVGKVTKIDVPLITTSSIEPIKVTFEASQVWLGLETKTITLTTARDSASCGYAFEENEEYLVYAHREEGQFITGLCSGTKLLVDAQKDVEELNQIKLPLNPEFNDAKSPNFQMWYLGLAILVLAAAILFFWSRSHKRIIR